MSDEIFGIDRLPNQRLKRDAQKAARSLAEC